MSVLRKAAVLTVLLCGVLRSAGADTQYASIDEAIARGDLADVRAHLKADPATANKGTKGRMTPLQQAILRNRPEIAATLVEAGADVDAKDGSQRTPLHLAVERRSLPMVEMLLEHKARANELDRVGWTPLHHAAAKDLVDIARALLDGGADPATLSEGGGTALHEAAASGSPDMFQLLLDRGVDPLVVSKTGDTAAMIALRRQDGDAHRADPPAE